MLEEIRKESREPSDEEIARITGETAKVWSRFASLGGIARAKKLSARRRKEISRKAAETRWKKVRKEATKSKTKKE